MPTWAMHLLTAKRVSKRIKIDENQFAFGNLLPDIPNRYLIKDIKHFIPHSVSHFETDVLVCEHLEKRYNLREFADTYKENFSNPLMLGYYVHLLTDYFWNSKAYDEHGFLDEERNRIGLIYNSGVRLMCSKSEARKIKTNDLKIYSQYIYEKKMIDELKYDDDILKNLEDVEWIKLDKDEINMVIDYIMDRYTGKEQILEKDERRDYRIFSKSEMEKGMESCVTFIMKMIDKHADYLLIDN